MEAVMTQTPPGRRVVVGVDGSAASDAAVRWAVREARLRRAAVHLVCACHSDPGLRAPYASWSRVGQDERYAAARALLDRATQLASRRLRPERLIAELASEPPARALIDRSAGAEMLVLGTSRPAARPGQPPLAPGPVARICVRRAHCPVVVVAPDDLPGEHDDQPERHVTRPRRESLATTGGRRPALPSLASAPPG
jgi:nucleotide-binding universal stress UspA family protein